MTEPISEPRARLNIQTMMNTMIKQLCLGSFFSSCAFAGGVTSLKSLTETDTLRPLEADRPDATESPRTVDAGHFQIESSLFAYSRNRNDGLEFESWSWGETNLKYGLNDSIDLQLVIQPYVRESSQQGGEREIAEGFGDLAVRLKWNLWGNDEGDTAMALFPYVKIPTGTDVSNDEWEGGVIFPWAMDLSERVGLGLQGEVAHVWNDDDGDHQWDFLHTAVLGVDLTDRLGVYMEYLGIAGEDPYQAYVSGGITWAVTSLFQWDAGLVLGLNDEAEDLNTFTGFTLKF